jgi:hypothetical protein
MKKRLIRQSVFETNSSSAHSISLGKDTGKQFLLDTLYPDQNGIITLTGGEFGWEWFKENDAFEKANYAAVASMTNDSFRETLIQVIKDQTGAEDIIFNFSDEYNGTNWSYIDHDSVGTCPIDYEGLKDFIFNKNSWLFGGNDNTSPDPTFYHVPEYRDGKMIHPTYKWEMVIDGFKKTTKFLTFPTNEEIEDALLSLLSGVYYNNGVFDDDNGIYAQINRNKKEWLHYSSYNLPPDIENGIIYFVTDDYFKYDRDLPYHEQEILAREFYKKTAQAVKFSINEIK